MGIAPVQANESVKAGCAATSTGVSHRRTNKRELAARYDVGIRTIENWQYAGIIRARSEQGQAVFDVVDCDRRLLDSQNQSPTC